MGKHKSFRHFKALTRKNFILWWRSPLCSLFEIVAPIILMVALTVIRMQVPTTKVDQEGMLKKKFAVFPGAPYKGLGTWIGNTSGNPETNEKIVAMTCYSDYITSH